VRGHCVSAECVRLKCLFIMSSVCAGEITLKRKVHMVDECQYRPVGIVVESF